MPVHSHLYSFWFTRKNHYSQLQLSRGFYNPQPVIFVSIAAMSAQSIPLFYQFVFLYFDPLAAFFGALLLFTQPPTFLETMSPTARYALSNKVIYDQLGATYGLFAWNEAVVLRVVGATQTPTALKTWKAVLLGILVCDAIHLYGSWDALGATIFWNPVLCRWQDWVNLGILWGQALVRVAFLLDVGLQKPVGRLVKTE